MSAPSQVVDELAGTGALRAVINLGNPVLAQGDAEDPRGVTAELAREFAARLLVPVEFVCVTAARDSVAAVSDGRVDVGFVAIDPGRAESLAFTPPYVVIEGVYAVPADSEFVSAADVDRPGVRVGVKLGSAYDLAATRLLQHAEVVRGEDGTVVFTEQDLEVAAGIRRPLTEFAEANGLRVLEPPFTQIEQAVAVSSSRSPAVVAWLSEVVEELKASGLVADALARSGRGDATVAGPAAGTDGV